MNEKFKNVVDWTKTHKKEILIATVSGAALIIGGVSFAKVFNRAKEAEDLLSCWEPNPTNFQIGLGTVTTVWTEADRTHMIINNTPLSECGKFGELIREKLITTDDEYMDVVMALGQNYNVRD